MTSLTDICVQALIALTWGILILGGLKFCLKYTELLKCNTKWGLFEFI